jgi:hypothetical protein
LASTTSFLGPARLVRAAPHRLHYAAELGDRQFGLGGKLGDGGAVFDDVGLLLDQQRPAMPWQLGDTAKPIISKLVADVMPKERRTFDASTLSQPQQPALL